LINLLSNAAKFTKCADVWLEISRKAAPESEWICLTVRDTGIGITPAQQSHLFKAFSQADSSTTRRFGGTGLGLALSQRLAQAMGGDILMESAAGEGSRFTLRLPTKPPREPANDLG
jgi:signal transduction histidine kinase